MIGIFGETGFMAFDFGLYQQHQEVFDNLRNQSTWIRQSKPESCAQAVDLVDEVKKKPTWTLLTTQSLFVLVFVIVIVIEARTPRYSYSTNHCTSIACVSCPKTSCSC